MTSAIRAPAQQWLRHRQRARVHRPPRRPSCDQRADRAPHHAIAAPAPRPAIAAHRSARPDRPRPESPRPQRALEGDLRTRIARAITRPTTCDPRTDRAEHHAIAVPAPRSAIAAHRARSPTGPAPRIALPHSAVWTRATCGAHRANEGAPLATCGQRADPAPTARPSRRPAHPMPRHRGAHHTHHNITHTTYHSACTRATCAPASRGQPRGPQDVRPAGRSRRAPRQRGARPGHIADGERRVWNGDVVLCYVRSDQPMCQRAYTPIHATSMHQHATSMDTQRPTEAPANRPNRRGRQHIHINRHCRSGAWERGK